MKWALPCLSLARFSLPGCRCPGLGGAGVVLKGRESPCECRVGTSGGRSCPDPLSDRTAPAPGAEVPKLNDLLTGGFFDSRGLSHVPSLQTLVCFSLLHKQKMVSEENQKDEEDSLLTQNEICGGTVQCGSTMVEKPCCGTRGRCLCGTQAGPDPRGHARWHVHMLSSGRMCVG